MAIRENSTVEVISGVYKGNTGKVVRIYGNVGVAVVQFNDGSLGKVYTFEVTEILPKETEPKTEIPEGAKKISRADFDAAIVEATHSVMTGNYRNPTAGIVGAVTGEVVGLDVADRIFKGEDVVVMTEEDLVVALWDGCNPKNVSASVGNLHPVVKCLDVSVAAILSLRKIGRILFGGENG
mgnify:CR=1 FL=1